MTYEELETADAEPSTDDRPSLALEGALERLARAKAAEATATAARIAAETDVLTYAAAREEGSVTVAGQKFKATVTYGINRTIDAAALEAVRGQMAPGLFDQAITYKPAIVLAGLRYLRSNEPAAYAVLAQAITAKPAKPSVKLEPINANQDP